MRRFAETACIDWSGARGDRLPGIALAVASGDEAPRLVTHPGGWSRAAILDWIGQRIAEQADMLIGIDCSAAFPHLDKGDYFPGWEESPKDAQALWALVERLSAVDPHLGAHSFLTHPEASRHFRHPKGVTGDRFGTGIGRLRLVEQHQRATGQANSASCFNLVGAGQVGKASLSGMRLLHRLSGAIPIWPFDPVPETGPCLVEIYTSMAARAAGIPANRSKLRDHAALDAALAALGSPQTGQAGPIDDHRSDALLTAAWLRSVTGHPALWTPQPLTPHVARTEGWTFGVL